MPTTTVTRSFVESTGAGDWLLIVDTSTKKKVYISNLAGSATRVMWLRYQETEPTGEVVPDVIIPDGRTHQEDSQRYTGKIWGCWLAEGAATALVSDFD